MKMLVEYWSTSSSTCRQEIISLLKTPALSCPPTSLQGRFSTHNECDPCVHVSMCPCVLDILKAFLKKHGKE